MLITIKTLNNSMFKVEIEPDNTVKDLKDKIEKDHGKDYPCGSQKLIYSGKILSDDTKLSEYNIDEKKFVVLMITRPPPAPKLAPAAQTATTPTTTTTLAASAVSDKTATNVTNVSSSKKAAGTTSAENKPAASESASPSSQASRPVTQSSSTSNNNNSSTNNNNNDNINNNNNPRSNPTPSVVPASATASQRRPPTRPNFNDALGVAEPQMAARLQAMMSQPQFVHIQELIQQSPHLLSSAIDNLATTEPEFYNFISENPDLFPAGPGAERRQAARRSGAHVIEVSERDKQAIERLKELGFSEGAAYEAYIACDKDEQLAANLLFQMEQ